MSLYTKKGKEFVKLTRDQARRIRRTEQVIDLQNDAKALARTTRALTGWLSQIQRNGMKMTKSDLMVARIPNIKRIRVLADNVEEAIKALRNH